jgi:hypothetical protein
MCKILLKYFFKKPPLPGRFFMCLALERRLLTIVRLYPFMGRWGNKKEQGETESLFVAGARHLWPFMVGWTVPGV